MTLPHGIDSEILKKRYLYRPETGEFVWRERFDFLYGSGKKKGDLAGKWRGNDYVVSVQGHELTGRKLAWWFMTGVWPTFRVGVRDGDFQNLAWSNLGPHSDILLGRRTRTCPICGTVYQSTNPLKQKTCSFSCAGELRRRGVAAAGPAPCLDCGGPRGDSARSRCTPCVQWVARRRRLASAYGLTPDAFQQLLSAQGSVCAICGEAPDDGPVVDHDHATGAIRGVLCHGCNKGLGHFRDSAARLRAAAGYLERP